MTSRSTALAHTDWSTDTPGTSVYELKNTTTNDDDCSTRFDGEAVHTPTPSRPGSPRLAQGEAPDGGRQAWLVLLGAFSLTFIYCGLPYGYGVFQAAFSKTDLAPTPILVILGSIPLFVLAVCCIRSFCFVPFCMYV